MLRKEGKQAASAALAPTYLPTYLPRLTRVSPLSITHAQVDLDLGNYERFMSLTLSRDHNITTGKVYNEVRPPPQLHRYPERLWLAD